jgi:hypothetical protein
LTFEAVRTYLVPPMNAWLYDISQQFLQTTDLFSIVISDWSVVRELFPESIA